MSALRTQRLHEQVAAALAQEIVGGRIPADTPIPSEPELAERFEVSKTVAREASQLLAAHGLVRVQHGKRTVARPAAEWNILNATVQRAFEAEGLSETFVPELYEVRRLLEPQGAAIAARRSDPAQLERIAQHLERMERSVGVADEQFLEMDREFHLAILSALEPNRVLNAILRDINALLRSNWALIDLTDHHREVVQQHAEIADAIRANDSGAASDAMQSHLEWALERYRRRGDQGR